MQIKNLDDLSRKQALGILVILLAVLAFIVYRDYLLLDKLFLFKDIGSDTLNAFYPHLVHIADYLRSDGVPLWSFNRGMGQGVFSVGIGSLFEWPLFAMGSDRLAYGIAYMEVAKILLGGIVFYGYLRLLSLNSYTCVIGGLLYAFSGFMIVGSSWYIFSTMAVYLAMFLYAFERYLQQGDWRFFPPVVALIAASDVSSLYTQGLFLMVYGTFRYCDCHGWKPRAMAVFFAKVAGLGLLGAGITATFVLAGLQDILQSQRIGDASGSLKYLFYDHPVFSPSEPLANLVTMMRAFSSNMLGVASGYHGKINYLEDPLFYCGLICLLIAPQVFIFPGRRQRILHAALAMVFFLLVLLPYFRYAFWLFTGDYYRIVSLFIAFVVLFLAARALNGIMTLNRLNVPLLAGTLLVLLCGLLYPYELLDGRAGITIDPFVKWATAGFLCLYAVLIVGLGQPRLRAPAAALLLLAICGELAMTASMTINNRPVVMGSELHEHTGYNDYSVDVIKHLRNNDPDFYRIEKTYVSGPAMHASLNDGMVQRYRGTSSYQSLNQNSYLDFMDAVGLISDSENSNGRRWILGLRGRPVLMMFASVKYVLIDNPRIFRTYTGMGFHPVYQAGDVVAVQIPQALPFGFSYDAYLPRAEFMRLKEWQKDSALIKAAVLDTPIEEIAKARFRRLAASEVGEEFEQSRFMADIHARQSQAMKIDSFNQNEIAGRIELKQDGLICFTIPFDEGWEATVDGVATELLRINIGFTGLMVGPGSHVIKLKYRPTYWVACWVISGISLAVYLLCLYLRRKTVSLSPAH